MYRKAKSQLISIVVLLLACVISTTLKSQTRISTPYSRYGIGSLNHLTNARTLGMGGADQALSNPLYINFNNPASYADFKNNSFVFNGGLRAQRNVLETQEQTDRSGYSSLGYLEFGTPITEWMGASFGLIPYSNVGYNIEDSQVLDNIGAVKYTYEGSGGVNQFYVGSGFSILPNLTAGFNAIYYFSKMSFTRSSKFPDSTDYLDIRIKDRQSPGDIGLNFGIQYEKDLGKNHTLTFGGTYSMQNHISATRDYIVESLRPRAGTISNVQDTVTFREGNTGEITLPASFGFGIKYSKKQLWQIIGDFKYTSWKNFKSFGVEDSLQNSLSAALGLEFSPKSTSVSGYFKRMDYRLGASFKQSYLQLRGTRLNKIGINFGLSFPLPKSPSTIDIGVKLGQMGTTDHNLLKENYIKASLGLSIIQNWYRERKYD